ncbi:hypothetical protein BC829DRAFT_242775 [Chytridium lagenaria]|nr:hypothetical protein BC829DRAFT_242775 [Chytridium lagenaria]
MQPIFQAFALLHAVDSPASFPQGPPSSHQPMEYQSSSHQSMEYQSVCSTKNHPHPSSPHLNLTLKPWTPPPHITPLPRFPNPSPPPHPDNISRPSTPTSYLPSTSHRPHPSFSPSPTPIHQDPCYTSVLPNFISTSPTLSLSLPPHSSSTRSSPSNPIPPSSPSTLPSILSRAADDSDADGSKRDYACTFNGCGMVFSRRHNLLCHMTMHTGERPHACTVVPGCMAAFRRRQDLYRHIRSVHEQSGNRPHACQHCGRRFARADGLASHLRRKHMVEVTIDDRTGTVIFSNTPQPSHPYPGVAPHRPLQGDAASSYPMGHGYHS